MDAFFIGLFLLLIGLAFAFVGYPLFRILIPIWGFIAGFAWGAEAIAVTMGTGFLATGFGWLFGFIVGLAIAAVAYYFYVFEVAILFGFIGYWALGSIMLWLGMPYGFFVTLVASIAGIALAIWSVFLKAPKGVLIFFTAFSGAALTIAGLLMMFGQAPVALLGTGFIAAIIGQSIWWTITFFILGIVGLVYQINNSAAIDYYEESTYTYTPGGAAGAKGGKSTSNHQNGVKHKDAK